MNQHLQSILNSIQQAEHLNADEKNALIKSIKDADKEFAITEFKLDRTEKVKRTTAILLEETIEELEQKRKAVEAQNRELEIETSLEKVRTVAMGMRQPDDLLNICEVMFNELKKSGFDELRNAMINIHYDDKAHILNYDYSDSAGKTVSTFKYNTHPIVDNLIYHAKQSSDHFTEMIYAGKDLHEWRNFRKQNGEADDARLNDLDALYYYFYSTGTGAVGISLFKAANEEQLNVLKRFRNVFDLAYKRYVDITNAEAQAREAQIEAALERVRSRSLAVHKSDEFNEVIKVVFERLQELKIPMTSASINVIIEGSKDVEAYICGQGEDGLTLSHIRLIHFNHPISKDRYDAYKKGLDFFSNTYSKEEKNSFYEYQFEVSDLKYVPDDIKKMVFESERYTISLALAKNSMIVINDFEGKSLSENEIDIVKRFSRVFEQAYIRFLDLQKAEEQSRESQIQLALERVRARTMAMQRSDELQEAASLMFQQIEFLGAPTWNCSFNIWTEDKKYAVAWNATKEGFGRPFYSPSSEDVFLEFYAAAQQGKELFIKEIGGSELEQHYQYLSTIPGVSETIAELKAAGVVFPAFQIFNIAYFTQGYLMFITYKPVPEFEDIFKRFAKTFEQTYTRFLDLQRAEEQAREAQIELALERVRARAMAMQNSDELKKLIGTVFTELTKLDFVLTRSVIFIFDPKTNDARWWMANSEAPSNPMSFLVKYHELPPHLAYLKGWKNRTLKWQYELKGRDKKDWDDFLFTETELSRLPDFVIAGMKAPDRVFLSASFNNFGNLTLASLEPLSDEHFNILLRFAKVFDLTYTRFNDLQNAEAQAREAKIEAALERVRSRSMGMQKSDELKEVIQVVYEQFVHLNINVEHTGFIMDYKERDDMLIWLADKQAVPFQVTIPYFDSPHWNSFNDAKATEKNFFTNRLSFEEKNKFYQDLFKLFSVPDEAKEYYFSCPGLAISTVLLDNVGLYIENFSGTSYSDEENKTLMRFAKVFQQTYTRFNDLKQAEARSRESQIEAALEKVRSRSLAMHKSDELNDVVKLVFEKLNELNIELNTAFIIIFKENSRDSEWWLINKTDQQYASIFVKYIDLVILREQFETKEQGKELFAATYHGKEKQELFRYLFTQTDFKYAPAERQKYIFETDAVSISMAMTKKIAIQITRHTEKLFSNEENEIVKRFTKVFDQSYTRFLDLQKAEAQTKEAQIEAALERVRSRTLAMQKSDELAETSAVLFKQLISLGIKPNRLYISIMKDDEGETEFWITDEDASKVSMAYQDNLNNNSSFKKMYDGWKRHEKSLVIDMKGKELQEYFKHLSSIHVSFKGGLEQKRRLQYIAYFSKGFIGMASPDEQPAETLQLLERFAYVFNLTFTRFNDLQIAEAHALQADQDLIEIKAARKKAEETLVELQSTQKQLIQSEKMASLGELTAGIAHEIQNPLNFVNNFSEVSKELLDEMKAALESGDKEEAEELANDIIQNLEKINHHGKRADAIVKGMLQHSRQSKDIKEPTDINALCDEYLRLCFHGLRAKDKSFNSNIKTDFDASIQKINIVSQDIGRVILNVLTNAFYAVNKRSRQSTVNSPQPLSQEYKPLVSIETKKINDKIEIVVKDNGNGIPQNIIDKIFQPFFTTKPTGEGTGLGLSLSYDIIKAHGGEIKVNSKEGKGSEFVIELLIA